MDELMEQIEEDQLVEASEFGLPKTWDGAEATEGVIWIDKIASINAASWEYLRSTRQINWVIIPMESANHGHSQGAYRSPLTHGIN